MVGSAKRPLRIGSGLPRQSIQNPQGLISRLRVTTSRLTPQLQPTKQAPAIAKQGGSSCRQQAKTGPTSRASNKRFHRDSGCKTGLHKHRSKAGRYLNVSPHPLTTTPSLPAQAAPTSPATALGTPGCWRLRHVRGCWRWAGGSACPARTGGLAGCASRCRKGG